MASGSGPALAHRSVASIRAAPTGGHSPASPHTPSRGITSAYGSPSAVRADDDVVVIELGSRHIRAGFAGDSTPKAVLQCGPEDQRRVGDFRSWQGANRRVGLDWAEQHEIWRYDMRDFDLGLFRDRFERLLKDALTRYLLIDSRPRRMGLILDSAVPMPLLTAVLDTIFNKFQSPTISLMSSAAMATAAAGVRSALVIDMGWAETVVTSVYEYREVKSTRTIRGGSFLLDALYKAIRSLMVIEITGDNTGRAISFEECEDILCRLMWCRSSAFRSSQRQSAQLETVEEQDEEQPEISHTSLSGAVAEVPLNSANPPSTIEVPFEILADVCDDVYFDPSALRETFDDHELPIHLLVYQHLLQLPIDVRAICMSRIIFTGGCSNILGLKERIIDEVTSIIDKRSWALASGQGVDQLRNNPKLRWQHSSPQSAGSQSPSDSAEGSESAAQVPLHLRPDFDSIEAKVQRSKEAPKTIQGQIRALHSLGPWTGGSLMCQLKVPAMAIIDREVWTQQGPYGAARPSEIDVKAQQRQSMSTGGFMRGSGGHHGNWTLGAWGYLS